MHPLRPLPDFWYPIARILLVLKALLTATAPPAFPSIAAHIYAELRLSGALVRRYLFALARELQLPPPVPRLVGTPQADHGAHTPRRPSSGFRIGEPVKASRGGAHVPVPDTYVEWALALQRTETLLAALREPEPIARRIARQLARGATPPLRELPIPAFVIRRIAPVFDILLMRLDAIARPDAWVGIELDSS